MQKITYWPAEGAPEGWMNLPMKGQIATEKKKIIIFSPHPENDVICMGATMARLNSQGHEVFVAYQTSGNIAVLLDDVIR